jgi:2-dehydro-3-deoxygluconokinase
MMKKVFCFGELLLRMSPDMDRQWLREAKMPVYIGGAELNVAMALARWKVPVKYCTALPQNYLADEIIKDLNERGIDTSSIHRSGNKIGVYYLPQGGELKNAGVIYDRSDAAFALLKPGMIDWDKALEGCEWFHFTAIGPGLNETVVNICMEALEAAKKKKLNITCDLNYRARLWQYGKEPVDVMPALINYCDVVMGNIWSAEQLLGIPASIDDSNNQSRDELIAAAQLSMKNLKHAFPGVKTIAYTFRLEKRYFAVIDHEGKLESTASFDLEDIVDKVGSGDCFMAGLIYGLYHRHSPTDIINFAAAAAVSKMQVMGDATNKSIEQVNEWVWKAMKGSYQQ